MRPEIMCVLGKAIALDYTLQCSAKRSGRSNGPDGAPPSGTAIPPWGLNPFRLVMAVADWSAMDRSAACYQRGATKTMGATGSRQQQSHRQGVRHEYDLVSG
jgi:hypothetical protein